jgi:predicted flap endonuclease-1-like 5' DNA nuclease
MRRFLNGFALGIVIGAVLAWLYQRYMCPQTETVPTRPAPVKVPPDKGKPKPATPDDFAVLHGVGAAFAERLHQAGIRTFASLARLTPEEVAERCEVPVWRIRRDDWIGQAAAQVQ